MNPDKGSREPEPSSLKQDTGMPPVEDEGKVSLRNLLAYDNPNLPKYQRLIKFARKESRWQQPQEFAPAWGELLAKSFGYKVVGPEDYNPKMYEKARGYFEEKLQGDILVDLGGGKRFGSQVMRSLAKKSGVKTYINVDMCHGKTLDPYTSSRAPSTDYPALAEEEKERSMDELFVADDILDFLARLPDNSCNFVANGVDHWVLGNATSGTGYEYGEAVFREMVRATKKGGVMFGIGSDIWGDRTGLKFMSQELGLQIDDEIDSTGNSGRKVVFEKIEEQFK